MTDNIFKYAAKKGLRFPYKGSASTEDLFNLSIEELDSVYKTLKKQQKTNTDESLIETKTQDDIMLNVKIAIVKEIFDDKQTAIIKAKKAAEKRAQKQKILEIMSQKENESLQNKSLVELQAELDKLDDDEDDLTME